MLLDQKRDLKREVRRKTYGWIPPLTSKPTTWRDARPVSPAIAWQSRARRSINATEPAPVIENRADRQEQADSPTPELRQQRRMPTNYTSGDTLGAKPICSSLEATTRLTSHRERSLSAPAVAIRSRSASSAESCWRARAKPFGSRSGNSK